MARTAILQQITKFRYLRHRLVGVFSADTFPIPLNTFIIVNSENSDEEGKHWLLICNKGRIYLIGDPSGSRLDAYKKVKKRLTYADFSCQKLIQKQLQPPTSNICGLYCINIAHYVFSGYCPVKPLIDDERSLRFGKYLSKLSLSSFWLKLPSFHKTFFSILDESK